jgi:hypothetical protein
MNSSDHLLGQPENPIIRQEKAALQAKIPQTPQPPRKERGLIHLNPLQLPEPNESGLIHLPSIDRNGRKGRGLSHLNPLQLPEPTESDLLIDAFLKLAVDRAIEAIKAIDESPRRALLMQPVRPST